MASRPSDLGFSDDNYILPELKIHEIEIKTENRDEYRLFNDVAVSATNFNQELRLTMEKRLNKVSEIVNGSKENFIIWVKQNAEAKYLLKLIPDALEVEGSMKPEMKEERLLGFGKNKFRVLITKAKIASFGLNYQNCHNQVFSAPDFSFESTYQGIRRSWRFGQKKDVNIYIIKTDTMQNVYSLFKQKQESFKQMQLLMKQNFLQS
jgi:superfamily II DNA/RNA helicase